MDATACYKAATVGPDPDCPRPFRLSEKCRFRDAWKDKGPKFGTRVEARARYVSMVDQLSTRG